ncbi:hypothetical protein [Aurantiacibacter suaedae]|uniref:hypothetical protein n=1 Tax=Aurantiacibacter suaedae TaxID=2545755 RepID=UPI0010F547F0|nr:hypothetical protein [Aurantiacibacter suaedae]
MIFSSTNARWQTVLADLSLILFLVAASALDESPAPVAAATRAPREGDAVDTGETADVSLTMWSPGPAAPPLAEWLAEQTPDESQRLAIVITYAKGGFDEALATASTLRAESGSEGSRARITIAEGDRSGTMVSLVQDDPPPASRP